MIYEVFGRGHEGNENWHISNSTGSARKIAKLMLKNAKNSSSKFIKRVQVSNSHETNFHLFTEVILYICLAAYGLVANILC